MSFRDELTQALGLSSSTELPGHLGLTAKAIAKMERRKAWTPKQVAKLAARLFRRPPPHLIRPVVEFFPVHDEDSRHGASREVFTPFDDEGEVLPWYEGLLKELKGAHGVYLFYDSRGRALYSGKAKRQDLWTEMKSAFNRDRDVQRVRMVRHPLERRREYRSRNEQVRQIQPKVLALHDLAAYFSAYEVHADLIDDVEALLVRGFANDLMNVRMETFEHQRAVRSRGRGE